MSDTLRQAVEAIEAMPREEPRIVSARDLGDRLEPEPAFFDIVDDGVDIFWGGYEYQVSWDQMNSPERLLGWIAHISEKTWPLTTPERISRLISAISHNRGWDIRL